MPSTIQTFAGSTISTGDEAVVKHTGTLYPAECTDVDTETDTPIFTVTEDGVGVVTGYTFVDCPPEERELQADGSWFWKYRR